MKSISFFSTILFSLLFITLNTFAQNPERDKSIFYDYGRRFFAEAHLVPTGSPDTIRALVLFRAANSYFSFIKSTNLSAGKEFYAVANVNIEFRDSVGIIRKHENWKDTIYASNYDMTKSKNDYHYGSTSTLLPAGNYRADVSLYDQNLNRTIYSYSISLQNKNFLKSPSISQPFYGEYDNTAGPNQIAPYVLDSGISFKAKDPRIFVITTFRNETPTYTYRCEYNKEIHNLLQNWGGNMNLKGTVQPQPGLSIMISPTKVNDRVFLIKDEIKKKREGTLNTGVIEIPLPINQLVPGVYDLTITDNSTKDSMFQRFRVEWETMPLSLRKTDYAAESMQLLLTDNEYDYLRDGPEDTVFKRILEYWSKYDPNPATPYNEVMTTFFERVDYAYFNYQTLAEKDGSKTDRGKIYILNGPPSNINRVLSSNGDPVEVWEYNKLRKEYVFTAVSSGIYKLKQINDLTAK